ncbi:MAG: HAMP domain-containing sensor histidine kinase [Verrucomicrobiota bacterium]
MKLSRSLLVWATLAICVVMVLGTMAWLTRDVLAAERERQTAEARADLEERTRLALWRMDAAGAAILLAGNQRPPAAFSTTAAGWTSDSSPLVNLHFEVRSGNLTSPEAHDSQDKLKSLHDLLSKNGDISVTLDQAARASESAWQSTAKDASALQSQVADSFDLAPAAKRASPTYQANSNTIEKAQRAKVVESQEDSAVALQAANSSLTNSPTDATPILEITSMRGVWIAGELFLLRHVSIGTSANPTRIIQGVWLDSAKTRQHLLATISDLLPAASLEPYTVASIRKHDSSWSIETPKSADPLILVSFPMRLERNAVAISHPLAPSKPLIIGWAAVLLSLLTASLLVHAVMRLSERRASFVSAVTHELRTPLTTFRLYSDMLESGAVKEEKRGDYLRVLSREADRLSHLVENVLSFSKVERGSARSLVRETTVGELLDPMRERFEARLATAALTLEMDTTCSHRVRVDAAAIEHILFNLIDNAAKYATTGEPPVVKISAKPVGKLLEITVQDHGPGIPVSERRRIFRAFHKSAREAAESRPGVGLGLALSRRLAKSLGGSLDCLDSEKGARFALRIPIANS